MEKINVMNKDNFNDLFEDNDVFGEAKNEEYTLEDGVTKNDDKRRVKEEQKEEQKETAKKQTNKIDTDKVTKAETNSELQQKNKHENSNDESVDNNQETNEALNEADNHERNMTSNLNDVVTSGHESQIIVKLVDNDSKATRIVTLQGIVGQAATDEIKQTVDNFKGSTYELVSKLEDINFTEETQTIEINFKHKITKIKRTKEITQTIEFSMSDGSQAPKTIVNTVNVKQTGELDNVTKRKKWDKLNTSCEFPAIEIPEISGYTADHDTLKQSVQVDSDNFDDDLDLYTVINYVIDRQNICLRIIDKTTGEVTKKIYHGLTNQKTAITTKSLINHYTKRNYELLLDETNGEPLAYDNQTGHDQVYLVEFKHKIQELTLENPINQLNSRNYTDDLHRVLKRTIKFDIPNYQKEPVIQKVEFVRKGYLDLVTSKIEYSKWTPKRSYPAYEIPDINGYTHQEDVIESQPVSVSDQNKTVVVKYKALNQKIKLVFYDKTIDQAFNSLEVQGETNSKPKYDFKTAIVTLKNAGYNVENTDYEKLRFNADEENQEYVIKLTHNTKKLTLKDSINPVTQKDMKLDLQKETVRKIDFIISDKVEKPRPILQKLDFIRTDTVDLVTGEDSFSDWKGNSKYPEVKVPVVPGYDSDVTIIPAHDSGYEDNNITVEYEAHLFTVNIVIKDIVTKTVLVTKELTARTNEDVNEENNFDMNQVIADYEQDGYKLISNEYDLTVMPASPKKQYVIELGHKTKEIDINNPINPVTKKDMSNLLTKKDLFTIKYQLYRNDKVVAPDKQYTNIFHRIGHVDLVTGKTDFGEWIEDKELPIIKNPEIDDYDSLADLPNAKINAPVNLKDAKSNIVFVKYYPKKQELKLKFVDQEDEEINSLDEYVTFDDSKHEFNLGHVIDRLIHKGYGVNSKDYPKVLTYDKDLGNVREYVYHLHETYTIKTNAKNIVRKILIENPTGSLRAITQTSRITQKVEISNVTKKETKGKWSKNFWDPFIPSRIVGYEADQPKIEQKIVDYNTEPETVHIKYVKGFKGLGHNSNNELNKKIKQKRENSIEGIAQKVDETKSKTIETDKAHFEKVSKNESAVEITPRVINSDKVSTFKKKAEEDLPVKDKETTNEAADSAKSSKELEKDIESIAENDPADIAEKNVEKLNKKKKTIWNTLKKLFK